MKEKSISSFFAKNILLFIIFGILVAGITSYINYTLHYEKLEKKIEVDSNFVSQEIKNKLFYRLNYINQNIESTRNNKLFLDYLANPTPENENIAIELFINNMNSNINFFQYRFIDKNGMEKIRIDRDKSSKKVIVIEKNKLQNKSSRYYFQSTISNKNKFWSSYLDLNIENGDIETPLKPTYRISTNVYYKNIFYGILIVNIDMKSILSDIRTSNRFYTYLYDNDGYYIVHPDTKKEWSKYLKSGYNIYKDYPSIKNSNRFNKYGFVFQLEDIFENGENIHLAIKAKDNYIKSIISDSITFVSTLGIIILAISITVALIISIPISKIYADFNKLYKQNNKYLNTIDKYVATMNIGLDAKIKNVSSKLCQLSGFPKDELIGKHFSLLKNNNDQDEVYKELWDKVKNGFIWSGELKSRTKDGTTLWLDSTILPNYNKSKKLISFTSISQNVTHKKLLEIASKTDKLTQLFNRGKLDEYLEDEYNKYQRHKSTFSVIMIDIDNFKSVNDTYGHHIGDSVLIEIADILKNQTRKIDTVGRWGGEEFLIVCLETTKNGAILLAEKLRKRVENFTFNVVKRRTISLGVAEIEDNDTIATLLERADINLYKAKKNGKNKVYY